MYTEKIIEYAKKFMVQDGKIFRLKPGEMNKYYANPAMSQTYLKALKKSLYSYLKLKHKVVTEPMLLGRAVDSLITGDSDSFNEEFCVVHGDVIPNAAVLELMIKRFDPSVKFDDIPKEQIVSFIRENNIFNKNWKDDTVYEKMRLTYADFWDSCVEKGYYRTPLPLRIYEKALDMVAIAKSKPVWKWIMGADYVFYQLPLYTTIKDNMNLKSLLDIVIIPDATKPNVHIIDLKTTNGDIIDFPKVYTRLNYGFQAKFYTMMMHLIFGIPLQHLAFSFYVVTDYTACLFTGPVYNPSDGDIDMALRIYSWYLENGFEEDYLVAKSGYRLMADFYEEDVAYLYEAEEDPMDEI